MTVSDIEHMNSGERSWRLSSPPNDSAGQRWGTGQAWTHLQAAAATRTAPPRQASSRVYTPIRYVPISKFFYDSSEQTLDYVMFSSGFV